jgi:hypothetical protein
MGRRLVAAVAVGLLAGCASTTTPSATARTYPDISINNSPTIPVTLLVNGTVLEVLAAGGHQDPVPVNLPSLPWRVEVRSPSGRLLSTLSISADTYVDRYAGVGVRTDLSCGRLDVWSGPPIGGPMNGTGAPGDCS